MSTLPKDPHVMVLVGFANGSPMQYAGCYLRTFDFEAFDGQGNLDVTDQLHLAKLFEGAEGVVEFWRTQSTVKPLREDGKPNRPLTAASIQPVPLLSLIAVMPA